MVSTTTFSCCRPGGRHGEPACASTWTPDPDRGAEARHALEVDVVGVAVPEEHHLAAVRLGEAAAGFRPHRHAQDQQAEQEQAEGTERTEDERAHQKAK